MVTGVTPKGVFVRVFDPPVEGRLMHGEHGLDVGDRLHVTLLSTDPRARLHRFWEGSNDCMLELLRHTLATLAYRGGKAVRGAPPEFAGFRAGPRTRTPAEILAHMGDLLDWALSLAEGRERWHDSPPLAWEQETARFFAALEALDARLAKGAPPGCSRRNACSRGRSPMR